MNYITIEDVRDYMYDLTADDNPLILETDFTDDEIKKAMLTVLREWNSIPPYINPRTDADKIPYDTNVFMDGIAAALLRRELIRNTRNEVSYKAGNMGADVDSTYIARLKELIPMFGNRFRQAAQDIKLSANLRNAYGQVG